jgi:hypothetical protein
VRPDRWASLKDIFGEVLEAPRPRILARLAVAMQTGFDENDPISQF